MSGRTFTRTKLLRRKLRMILTEHLIEEISQPCNSLVLPAGLHFCHLVIDVHHAFLIFHLMMTINDKDDGSTPCVVVHHL